MLGAFGLRVVAVVAHPDDEAWAIGGTLRALASEGAIVTVVCATSGEAGGSPERRVAELAASCDVLGTQPPVSLHWPDGGLAQMPAQAACTDLHDALVKLRPDIVLGLGEDGGYGHLDHTVLAAFVRRVVPQLAGQTCLLEVSFGPGQLAKVRRAIERHRPQLLDPAVKTLGDRPRSDDVVVDIRAHADDKLAAVRCHQSQLRDGDPRRFLGGALDAMLQSERYKVTAGARPVLLHITRDLSPRVNGGISVLVKSLLQADGPLCTKVISFDNWRPKRRDAAGAAPSVQLEDGIEVLRLAHPAHIDCAIQFGRSSAARSVVVHHSMLWDFSQRLGLNQPSTCFFQHVDQAEIDRIRAVDVATASAKAEQRALAEANHVLHPVDVLTPPWPVVIERDRACAVGSDVLRVGATRRRRPAVL